MYKPPLNSNLVPKLNPFTTDTMTSVIAMEWTRKVVFVRHA